METAPSTSNELVVADPIFSDTERFALAGFLAGYSGLTREAYALDLRQFVAWCERRALRLFSVKRADIECFGRELEDKGRARATVARRLCTITGFYRYAVEEELLDHPLAVHVRRPRVDYESLRLPWTETNSEACSSPQASARPMNTPSYRCSP